MVPDSLTVAIEALHQAISDTPDPQATQVLSQCLAQMTRVQSMLMQQQGGQQGQGQASSGGRDALLAQLGGGAGAAPGPGY